MSSTTASVSRNVRSRAGNFGPMIASAPSRNAVSVEITTPHACAWPVFAFSSRKIAAGSASPATAAITGTAARLRSVSSPMVNSRFTSRPTVKKKNAMSPSFTSWCSVRCAANSPTMISTSVSQNSSYVAPHGELAQAIAMRVKVSSRSADSRSDVPPFLTA